MIQCELKIAIIIKNKIATILIGNMYAFLVYQKEIIQQMMQFCDNNTKKFDFLFTIPAFLDYVCQLLILLQCCCDFEFICVFYPIFEQAVLSSTNKKKWT